MKDISIEELRERAALIKQMRADLEAIEELSAWQPDDNKIMVVSQYRANLEAIEELAEFVPSGDEITTAAVHRTNLEAIEEHTG
jgi:hypothetical protein